MVPGVRVITLAIPRWALSRCGNPNHRPVGQHWRQYNALPLCSNYVCWGQMDPHRTSRIEHPDPS